MAIDPELNLFTSDPELLRRGEEGEYERAARDLEALARPNRIKLLHALAVGEDTAQRAAVWCGISQSLAERELAGMAREGLVERRDEGPTPTFAPADGHLVVQLHVAIAHGREHGERHPRLLQRRRGRYARAG